MPTRMLREGILDSERVNRLDDEEENFYRRLMSIVDDYGRFEANRAKLRARLYPLKLDKKSEERIGDLLLACVRERLVFLYPSHGKTYLQLLAFNQQMRSKSKCPPPDDKQLKTFAAQTLTPAQHRQLLADAQQLITSAYLGVFVFGVEGEGGGEAGAASAAQPSPELSPERKPKDLAAVIAYAATIALPADEAEKFFHRFQAKGWKSGRTPLADWRSELRVWQARAREHAADKNSSGGAPAFDPAKPNAHTGGLVVVS